MRGKYRLQHIIRKVLLRANRIWSQKHCIPKLKYIIYIIMIFLYVCIIVHLIMFFLIYISSNHSRIECIHSCAYPIQGCRTRTRTRTRPRMRSGGRGRFLKTRTRTRSWLTDPDADADAVISCRVLVLFRWVQQLYKRVCP